MGFILTKITAFRKAAQAIYFNNQQVAFEYWIGYNFCSTSVHQGIISVSSLFFGKI
jgi:hypothetical protein